MGKSTRSARHGEACPDAIGEFFRYARDRYCVFLEREKGRKPPWTGNPVLRQYRFCNVFREDDATTRWFRENIRGPLRDSPRVALATAGFRWFNRISTGERIKHVLLRHGWHEQKIRAALVTATWPLLTGAYMIKTPPGMLKLDGICWCMARLGSLKELRCGSLERAHQHLMKAPYLGAFMSYEIICDLLYTKYLEDAGDVMSWASVGPGAARGLRRIWGEHPHCRYHYNNNKDQSVMIPMMRSLLRQSQRGIRWSREWPTWDMRTVEHTLCEFDKYQRARVDGQRLKRRFHVPTESP